MSMNRSLKSISCPDVKFFPVFSRLKTSFYSSRGRNYVILHLAVLVSAWIFPMIFPGSLAMATGRPPQGVEFLLFYGNDVRGETDPCG